MPGIETREPWATEAERANFTTTPPGRAPEFLKGFFFSGEEDQPWANIRAHLPLLYTGTPPQHGLTSGA